MLIYVQRKKIRINKFNSTKEKNTMKWNKKSDFIMCLHLYCFNFFFSAHILAPEDNTKTLSLMSVYLIKRKKKTSNGY